MGLPACAGSAAFCAAVPLADSLNGVRAGRVAAVPVARPCRAKRRRYVTCAALPWARPVPVPVVPLAIPVAPPPPVESVPLSRRLLTALRGAGPAYAIAVAVCLLCYAAWTVTIRRKNQQIRRLEQAAATTARRPTLVFDNDVDEDESGDNALWLNLSLFPSVSSPDFLSPSRSIPSGRLRLISNTQLLPCGFYPIPPLRSTPGLAIVSQEYRDLDFRYIAAYTGRSGAPQLYQPCRNRETGYRQQATARPKNIPAPFASAE